MIHDMKYDTSVLRRQDRALPREEACELLIAQFPTLEINGLTGKLSWDASGAVTKDPTVYVIKDGAYAMVE